MPSSNPKLISDAPISVNETGSLVGPTFLDELELNKTPIPDWARELIKLGIKLSELIEHRNLEDGMTLNLAISLPTRSYASTFINLGLQIGLRATIISSFSERAYFDALKDLPVDSEVRFYETPHLNRNARKRIFKGLVKENGEEMILLQDLKKSSSRDLVKAKGCYRIIQDDQQRVASLTKIKDFLERISGESSIQDAISYTLSSNPVGAIIGKNKIIDEEHKLLLGQADGDTNAQLPLNELTRLGTQTLLLSFLRDETCETLHEKQPPVVMYEGLSSASKYRDAYSPIVRIFIMDRQAPSSGDYRGELKACYASREAKLAPEINIRLPGVETLTYYSAY
jgi:hypothetical protein